MKTAITVRELIELLQDENPEAPVGAAYQYGDYGRTTCVTAIRRVREDDVYWSEYHNDYALSSRDEDDDPREPTIPMVVLS